MNNLVLQQFNNISVKNNVSTVSSEKRVALPVQTKDSFVRSNFNLEKAVAELKNIKKTNGEDKFNSEKIAIIEQELKNCPEKWESVSKLSKNPKIISSFICNYAKADLKTLNEIALISDLKTKNDEPRFSVLEVNNLSKGMNNEELSKVRTLAGCSLTGDDIISVAKNPKIKNIEKLASKINELESLCGKEFDFVKFKNNDYDKNSYELSATLNNGNQKTVILGENLDTESVEDVIYKQSENGNRVVIKKTNDYRNNTISKVRAEIVRKYPQPVVTDEVRIVKDASGKVQRTEYSSLSEVSGVLDSKYVYPNGERKIISSGNVDSKTGIVTIKKDFESLDGTKTQYEYFDDPQGNRICNYVITDKSGKALLNSSQTFEVVSENKFISSKNDKKYEINIKNNDKIIVKDLSENSETSINLNTFIKSNRSNLLPMLKKMSGDELIAMSKNVKGMNGVDDTMKSTYMILDNVIKTGNNLFTALHELGHAKDYKAYDLVNKETLKNILSTNKDINEIFETEKGQFNKAFPQAQRGHIGYFIANSDKNDGVCEAIAETNALLNAKSEDALFAVRSQYLQQYFPRTIALLASILDASK